MTYSYSNNKKGDALSTESVLAFLTANPDFFSDNQDLIKKLNIPHNPGLNIASLIERQIKLLREENIRLKNEIKLDQESDKAINHLRQHVYQFSLNLLSCDSLDEFSRLLNLSLGKWFAAHAVRLYIFNDNIDVNQAGKIFFLSETDKLRFMFSGLFNFNKPLCDSLQAEHLDALFNKETHKIKSSVLIPIQQDDWCGLFVLGSIEKDQYSIGEELDMMAYISDLVAFKLPQLVNVDS